MSIFDRGTGERTPAEKFDHFIESEKRMRPYRDAEQERIRRHAPDCYGTFGKCISCGCSRPNLNACVSHHNEVSYLADVNKRLVAALEKERS